jgi:hypothetical protein
MCFDRTEDFQRSSGGGVPIPSTKPSIADNGGSILGSLFNSAKGIFENVAAIELEKYELERLAELRAAEEAARIARDRELAGTIFPAQGSTTQKAIVGTSSLLAIGMLGAAAILIARR